MTKICSLICLDIAVNYDYYNRLIRYNGITASTSTTILFGIFIIKLVKSGV